MSLHQVEPAFGRGAGYENLTMRTYYLISHDALSDPSVHLRHFRAVSKRIGAERHRVYFENVTVYAATDYAVWHRMLF